MRKTSAGRWLREKLCVAENSLLRTKIAGKLVQSGYKPPFRLVAIKTAKGLGVKLSDSGRRILLAAYPKKDGFSVLATSLDDEHVFLLKKTFAERKEAVLFRNAAIRIAGEKSVKLDEEIWERTE